MFQFCFCFLTSVHIFSHKRLAFQPKQQDQQHHSLPNRYQSFACRRRRQCACRYCINQYRMRPTASIGSACVAVSFSRSLVLFFFLSLFLSFSPSFLLSSQHDCKIILYMHLLYTYKHIHIRMQRARMYYTLITHTTTHVHVHIAVKYVRIIMLHVHPHI